MYVGLNSTELAFFAFTSNFSLILAYVPEKDSKLYSIFSKKPGTSNLQILLLWCLQIILRTVLVEVKRGKKWLESEVSGPVCQSNFGQPFLPAVLSPSPSVCLSLSLFFHFSPLKDTCICWHSHYTHSHAFGLYVQQFYAQPSTEPSLSSTEEVSEQTAN